MPFVREARACGPLGVRDFDRYDQDFMRTEARAGGCECRR
ncbi:hypothetical protein AKJ09_09665 [Labilithrix luteola]|uniref:Uncharacterized protein n=1 Tax=Labilithrix luteola TaxID=1391654 RepID=A0A0K1QBF5_9BACT|nr:hypothetical protein AKJ09_09665 [Labilithrix luteola]